MVRYKPPDRLPNVCIFGIGQWEHLITAARILERCFKCVGGLMEIKREQVLQKDLYLSRMLDDNTS